MSDTTCHMSISLDGFVAGPDQSREDPLGKRGRELHGWHLGDERANEADETATGWLMRPRGAYLMGRNMFGPIRGEWNRRALDAAGVHAMGRRSYEIMGPHWAASEGPIATAMNEKPKAVFSRTLEKAEWGPAEIFGGDLGAAIADLKARDDEGTVLVHGGPDFAKSLTRLGLVDEFQLTTVPIAIGAGRSPFADLREHLKLDLVEEERFQSGALAQILVPKR